MDTFIWKLVEVRQDVITVMPEVHILFDDRLDGVEARVGVCWASGAMVLLLINV